jgi:hypothetical protein
MLEITAYHSKEIVEFIGYHMFIVDTAPVCCNGVYIKGIVVGFDSLF